MLEISPDFVAILIEEEDGGNFVITERRLTQASVVKYAGVTSGVAVGDKVLTAVRGVEYEIDGEVLKFIHKDDIIVRWRNCTEGI
jgi:co-chaperonin GroES (HSP10)